MAFPPLSPVLRSFRSSKSASDVKSVNGLTCNQFNAANAAKKKTNPATTTKCNSTTYPQNR